MITPLLVATQGLSPLDTKAVATQGFIVGILDIVMPGYSVTQGYGTPVISVGGAQYIYMTPLEMRIVSGLHRLTGGFRPAQWLWINIWQPLWNLLDEKLDRDDDVDP